MRHVQRLPERRLQVRLAGKRDHPDFIHRPHGPAGVFDILLHARPLIFAHTFGGVYQKHDGQRLARSHDFQSRQGENQQGGKQAAQKQRRSGDVPRSYR